jgi:hypothetical protein
LATCSPTGTVGPVDVRIVGFDLPRSFGTPDCAYRNIRVGIQRKAEVVDLSRAAGPKRSGISACRWSTWAPGSTSAA